jgi:hypothetical protein
MCTERQKLISELRMADFMSPLAAKKLCKVAANEIERLVEQLEFIAESHDAGRHEGLPEPYPAHDAETMWAVACESLRGTK